MKDFEHPVPKRYHEILFIGQNNSRGHLIDFKVPPVVVDSVRSIDECRSMVLAEHIDIKSLPFDHQQSKCFLIVRPTALPYRFYVKDLLLESGLVLSEEFELDNFMSLADVLYQVDLEKAYHWKWRIIMNTLHESGAQDQNRAYVYVLEKGNEITNEKVAALKKRIRIDMGELPVVVKHRDAEILALGLHHLHSPDMEHLALEYNALMHAKYKSSVFSVV
jgi:hypothetical protein